jgi:hypothetical protein
MLFARAQPPGSVFVREERETKTAKSRLMELNGLSTDGP